MKSHSLPTSEVSPASRVTTIIISLQCSTNLSSLQNSIKSIIAKISEKLGEGLSPVERVVKHRVKRMVFDHVDRLAGEVAQGVEGWNIIKMVDQQTLLFI